MPLLALPGQEAPNLEAEVLFSDIESEILADDTGKGWLEATANLGLAVRG